MNDREVPIISEQMVLGGYKVVRKLDVDSCNSLYVVEKENNINEINDDAEINYNRRLQIMKVLPYQTSTEKFYVDQEIDIVKFLSRYELFVAYDETFEEEIEVEYATSSRNSSRITKNCMFAIMKYYVHNDLEKEIRGYGTGMSDRMLIEIIYQMLKAMKILKDYGIVHHDIKLGNVLIVSNNPLKIALTDFEFAEILEDGEYTQSNLGTPLYMSPEILLKKEHGAEVDMWALGVCAYRLASKNYPFNLSRKDEFKDVNRKILNYRLSFPGCFFRKRPKELIELISKMLNKNQEERITVDDAIHDQLFKNYWDDEQKKLDDHKSNVEGLSL